MTKKKVIARRNLPIRFPLSITALAYLFLDKFNAPGWIWGAAGVVVLIYWAVAFFGFGWGEEEVDLFKK